MQHYFEIYLLQDSISEAQWDKLYAVICSFGGRLTKFDFIFSCSDNTVRFFIRCDKDLSGISNLLDGILLRPVSEQELEIPKHSGKSRFVNFVSDGNILDLKEKLAVKRSLNLEFGVFHIQQMIHHIIG